MGWADRQYRDGSGRGGFRDVLRRVFGDGENFFDWSLPLYTAWGIRVRVHLIYVIYIIAELVTSILVPNRPGFWFTVMAMGSLFLLVLLHEYGHCFACRWVGGTADKILMWPLGGLAFCQPPHNWRDSLITTLGGPGVNAVLLPVFGIPLLLLAGQGAVLFNPFEPGRALGSLYLSDGTQPYWLYAIWWFYFTNWALLAFNMLLVMYPMDAGRVVQELIWRKKGYHRATQIAATLGLAMAVGVLIFAMVTQQTTLMAIALFCGVTCWMEKRRLAMTVDEFSNTGYDFSRGYQSLPKEDEPPEDDKAAEKRRQREEAERQRLDAILAKIAQSGMSSLSRSERSWLRRTTEKRRKG